MARNVFFIIYTEQCTRFLVYELSEGIIKDVLDCEDCKELSIWLSRYVESRRQIKPLVQPEYFSCLDRCLRAKGVSYPGNFDDIIFSELNVPRIVLEFSLASSTIYCRNTERTFCHRRSVNGSSGKTETAGASSWNCRRHSQFLI